MLCRASQDVDQTIVSIGQQRVVRQSVTTAEDYFIILIGQTLQTFLKTKMNASDKTQMEHGHDDKLKLKIFVLR